jgi:hypothetical protein
MSYNLHNRSFLKEIDFTPAELRFLLKLAEALKLAKYAGTETRKLAGKEIALIFAKTSTRTRSAFEVAAYDQGAHVTTWTPPAPSWATRSPSPTPPRCWAGCMTASSTAATTRPTWKTWPPTPGCRSTTG